MFCSPSVQNPHQLKTIKSFVCQTVEENADSETIRTFQICVDDLRKGVLEPLEQVKEEYIPVSLKTSVENLAECVARFYI